MHKPLLLAHQVLRRTGERKKSKIKKTISQARFTKDVVDNNASQNDYMMRRVNKSRTVLIKSIARKLHTTRNSLLRITTTTTITKQKLLHNRETSRYKPWPSCITITTTKTKRGTKQQSVPKNVHFVGLTLSSITSPIQVITSSDSSCLAIMLCINDTTRKHKRQHNYIFYTHPPWTSARMLHFNNKTWVLI